MFIPVQAWEIGVICTILGSMFVFYGYKAEKTHKKAFGILYLGGFFFLALGVVCGMSYLM